MSLEFPDKGHESQPGTAPDETSLAKSSLPPLVEISGERVKTLWDQRIDQRLQSGELTKDTAQGYRRLFADLVGVVTELSQDQHQDWFAALRADLRGYLKAYFSQRSSGSESQINQYKSIVRKFLTWAQEENFLRIENADVDQLMFSIAPFKFRLFSLPMVENRIAEDLGRGAAGYRLRFKDFFKFVAEDLRGEDLSIYENNALALRERELRGEERLKARAEAWKAMKSPEQRQREEVVIDSVIEAICLDPECARQYAVHLITDKGQELKSNSDLSAVRKFLDWAFERGYSAFDGDVIEALRTRPAVNRRLPVSRQRSVSVPSSPIAEGVEPKTENERPITKPVKIKAKAERRIAKEDPSKTRAEQESIRAAQKKTEQFLLLRNGVLETMLREQLSTFNRAVALFLDKKGRRSFGVLTQEIQQFYDGVNYVCEYTGGKLKEVAAQMEQICWVGIEELSALQRQDILIEKGKIRFVREGRADGIFSDQQTLEAFEKYQGAVSSLAQNPEIVLLPEAFLFPSSNGGPLLTPLDVSELGTNVEEAENMLTLRNRLIGLFIRDRQMSFRQLCLMPLSQMEAYIMEVPFGGLIREYLEDRKKFCPSPSSRKKALSLAFSVSETLSFTGDDLTVYSEK